jgi:hypothetical protein
MLVLTLAAFAVAMGPALALAGDPDRHFDVVSHIFHASDTDRNGTLSPGEYTNSGLERYGVSFDEYDANGDGEASLQEYYDVYRRFHPGRGSVES